jgi:hypothetical protein
MDKTKNICFSLFGDKYLEAQHTAHNFAMSSSSGSSFPVSSSSCCVNGVDSTVCLIGCITNDFYIKRNALKKRSAEMFQVATDLIARKSEYADYAVEKHAEAYKAYVLHGETEWDAIFDADEE